MNVPTTIDIDAAVTLYYGQHEITTSDIQMIFGCGKTKANELRKAARAEQDAAGVRSYNASAVNVEKAYETWGLDIRRLERAQKHPKLRLGGVSG